MKERHDKYVDDCKDHEFNSEYFKIVLDDMTTEAAVAKLYYLFSCGYDAETVKAKMEENLRGEVSI